MKKGILTSVAFAVLAFVNFRPLGPAFAASFPRMAITINTSRAGSNVDFIARAFAKTANKYSPVNLVVNSTSGQIDAARDTMSAEPDGYVIGIVNNTVIINDVVGQTDFNSVDDLKILQRFGANASNWLAIKKELADRGNIKSLADLFRYCDEHPDELIISDRTASNTNMVVKQLMARGLKVTPADVGTSTDRLTNFLSGNCDIFVGTYGLIQQYIETGDVVCLVLCDTQRSSFTPDIPCATELGYDGLTAPSTYYIFGPKDLPDDVVAFFDDLAEKVTADPEFVADLASNTMDAAYSNAADTYTLLKGFRDNMISLGMGTGFQGK